MEKNKQTFIEDERLESLKESKLDTKKDILRTDAIVNEEIGSVPLNKIQRLKKEIIVLKSKDKKTKKKNKILKKLEMLMKKKKKKSGFVVVEYLTADYELKFQLCKIISGNLVVIENKVHKLNPDKIWRFGKDSCYILREMDRNPVSNDDYREVKERGDDTEADVPLIKAVLGAVQKQSASTETNKNNMIIIGVIVVIVIVAILFMK